MAGLLLKDCFEDHKTPLLKRIFWRARPLEVAKMLNSTEDAHTKTMSTFETDEHLQELTPRKFAKGATEALARRRF